MRLEYDFSNLQIYSNLPNFKSFNSSRTENTFQIVKNPLRQINCHSIADDFYSNLIDWSNENIFYCITNNIFSYNFLTSETKNIFYSPGTVITCIKHNKQLDTLCIGTSSGTMCFLDINSAKSSKYLFHKSRIGALETFGSQIVSGSRDKKSKIIDLRSKTVTDTLSFHVQEVCGISMNKSLQNLASGGNDNKIFIFDIRKSAEPILRLNDHKAAVKALSWSPITPSRLVSGGGTADKSIKHWDILATEPLVQSYNFESQICNLKWLANNKILSTFGYSNDDIKLLNNFKVEKKYTGHKNRVIHFSVEKNERFFVSGSGDATIKIWEIDDINQSSDIEIR